MRKKVLSVSIAAGMFLCLGLYSTDKVIGVENIVKSNIHISLASVIYPLDITLDSSDPGIFPPE
ncbi:hypothetical protein JK636_18615 [Clostridium sp. YIM B02515]|uniref:Uncharacterized protein n=1 Tax=Clostridium rhizosphaerae TaxID=2803861 RepID=A0ABS1TEB7_9CLOT|nr:hypothetical protein [Clostridium rhizosphaerae]MBL4937723.1 hypothetical protein [Clostridium rhizosphaerae]